MKKRNFSASTLLMVAVLFAPAVTQAQPAPAAAPAPTESSAPRRARAVSPEVAASIAAAMPKYNPPKPVEKKPEEELPDAREIDKPKNGIIRLPNYIVREPKSPVFRERDVNTPEGLAAIARKRYLSELDRGVLNRWSFLGVQGTTGDANTGRALASYADDERQKNIADLNDAAGLVSARDKAAGAYIRREAQQTTLRTSDFGWRNDKNK